MSLNVLFSYFFLYFLSFWNKFNNILSSFNKSIFSSGSFLDVELASSCSCSSCSSSISLPISSSSSSKAGVDAGVEAGVEAGVDKVVFINLNILSHLVLLFSLDKLHFRLYIFIIVLSPISFCSLSLIGYDIGFIPSIVSIL